jgi:hypothetical protein
MTDDDGSSEMGVMVAQTAQYQILEGNYLRGDCCENFGLHCTAVLR